MAGKRRLIAPRKGDERYVRRTKGGRFGEQDDVGRSLAADRRKKAKATAKPGQGDEGDRRTRTAPRKAARRDKTRTRRPATKSKGRRASR